MFLIANETDNIPYHLKVIRKMKNFSVKYNDKAGQEF